MKTLRKLGLGLCGVAILAFAASPAWAHCGKCAGDCKEMVKAMDTGKATAGSLIAAAEAASKGKAIAMVCNLDKGKTGAKVYCVADGKVQSVEVSADGKAGKVEVAKDADAAAAKAMEAAKLTAAKVIEAAEAHAKGKALAMATDAKGGKATYEVYALAGDKLQKVKVDDAGKAVSMEDAKSLPDSVVKKVARGG